MAQTVREKPEINEVLADNEQDWHMPNGGLVILNFYDNVTG